MLPREADMTLSLCWVGFYHVASSFTAETLAAGPALPVLFNHCVSIYLLAEFQLNECCSFLPAPRSQPLEPAKIPSPCTAERCLTLDTEGSPCIPDRSTAR